MMRSAAIFLAITGMGVFLTASESTGRPFTAGRPMPFHPGVGTARPLAATPRPAFRAQSATRLRGHARHARFHHRGRSSLGLWPWYDGYYPPDDYGAPYGATPYLPYDVEPPPYAPPPPPLAAPPAIKVIQVIPYRPGCDTEVEKVPWTNGSERSIRIVRC